MHKYFFKDLKKKYSNLDNEFVDDFYNLYLYIKYDVYINYL